MALFDGIRGIPDSIRDRRRRRRQGQQTGIAAPEIGRDFGGTTGRLADAAGGAAGAYADDRAAQGAALGLFQDAATGAVPSVAQNMLAQQGAQNVTDQMSMAAGGRGGNLAGMARAGAAAGAAAQMGTQQQLATLRAQEMDAARTGMAGLATNMAGLSSGRQMGFEQGLAGAQGAQLNADLAQRGLNIDQISSGRQDAAGLLQAGGQVAQNVGAIGQMSDRHVKDNIEPGGIAASEAMAALDPSTFTYQDPARHGQGQQIGVMAQDLEKSPAGAQIVEDTPEGKSLDVGGGMSLALAAGADQEKRIRELEARLAAQNGGLYSTLGGPTVPRHLDMTTGQQAAGGSMQSIDNALAAARAKSKMAPNFRAKPAPEPAPWPQNRLT